MNGIKWSALYRDTERNNGNEHEFFVARIATGEIRAHIAGKDEPDVVVKNANGAVVATIESKTGCGTLDSSHDLATFKRMPHCTHIAYNPRYNSADRGVYTVVVSYSRFIALMEKHELIRDVQVGSKRGGGYKVGCQNFLPTSTGSKPFQGTENGRAFLEELYEVGESLPDFLKRVGAVMYRA